MLTKELLQAVQNHELSVEQAGTVKGFAYHNMEYAKLIIKQTIKNDFQKLFLRKENGFV